MPSAGLSCVREVSHVCSLPVGKYTEHCTHTSTRMKFAFSTLKHRKQHAYRISVNCESAQMDSRPRNLSVIKRLGHAIHPESVQKDPPLWRVTFEKYPRKLTLPGSEPWSVTFRGSRPTAPRARPRDHPASKNSPPHLVENLHT